MGEERITSKFYQLRAGAKRTRGVAVCIMLKVSSWNRWFGRQHRDYICDSMCYINEWPKRFLKTFIQQYSDYQVRPIWYYSNNTTAEGKSSRQNVSGFTTLSNCCHTNFRKSRCKCDIVRYCSVAKTHFSSMKSLFYCSRICESLSCSAFVAIKSEINYNIFGFSGQSINWQWSREGLPLWCAADVPPVRSSFIYGSIEFY